MSPQASVREKGNTRKKIADLRHRIRMDRGLVLLSILPLAYFIIFKYVPIYGLLIAFKDFSPVRGILGSEWVGLKWFLQFFSSHYFSRLIRNTLLISVYSLIFGFPVPIAFALLLNEVKNASYKRIVQTVSYLPHFISVVIIVGMMVNFLSPNEGIVNQLLKHAGREPVDFMSQLRWFRPLYVGSGIWQSFGFSSIIYLAAIAGINPELYDAIEVDGGTRLQKIRFITLPSIAPTITILLILRVGRLMSIGFQKIILMYSPVTYEVADVISTYVYRRGIQEGEYGFATAVGFFNSVVNLVLLVACNRLARKLSETSLW